MSTFVFGFFLALAASSSARTAHVQRAEEGYDFVPLPGQRFDAFDWQLSSAVASENPGNVIVSPISVKLLLKMLYEGSIGPSSDELSKILELPKDKTLSRHKTRDVLHSLQTPNEHYDMEFGSKLFINENVTPKNWYQRILNLYYDAFIEKLDFNDSKSSASKINDWVKSVTRDHIKNFLSTGEGLESTVILLVNAVFFRGTWKMPFPKGGTRAGKFQTPEGLADADYMSQINYFYYIRSPRLKSQILRLPYLGQKFSMYIVLPESKFGLDELMRTIKPSELRECTWQMEETSLEVILPKFTIRFKIELKGVLRKLGIRKIFDSHNNMNGLTKSADLKDLVVSDVIQKAAIDVNEEGTVATAATEIQLINKFGGEDEIFNASHPFLFFIEDELTGAIVFVGKVVRPTMVEEAAEAPIPQASPALHQPKTRNVTANKGQSGAYVYAPKQ